MKCDTGRRLILLADSGELRESAKRDVDRHIAGCPGCRQYHRELAELLGAEQDSVSAAAPSAATLAAIRRAGAQRVAGTGPLVFVFRRPLAQVLAYAAALAVLAGGWLVFSGRGDRQDRIAELSTILAVVLEGHESSPVDHAALSGDPEEALRGIALQLLRMEGLAEEDFSETEYGVPESTTFRGHSTFWLPGTECV